MTGETSGDWLVTLTAWVDKADDIVWGLPLIVFNGLMAFPNLIALILLSPVVCRVTKEYFARFPFL